MRGAVDEYKSTAHKELSKVNVDEYNKKKWPGTPLQLIVKMMLDFYSEKPHQHKLHPVICPRLQSIGSSMVLSKKYGQIFQVIYISKKGPRRNDKILGGGVAGGTENAWKEYVDQIVHQLDI